MRFALLFSACIHCIALLMLSDFWQSSGALDAVVQPLHVRVLNSFNKPHEAGSSIRTKTRQNSLGTPKESGAQVAAERRIGPAQMKRPKKLVVEKRPLASDSKEFPGEFFPSYLDLAGYRLALFRNLQLRKGWLNVQEPLDAEIYLQLDTGLSPNGGQIQLIKTTATPLVTEVVKSFLQQAARDISYPGEWQGRRVLVDLHIRLGSAQ